MNPKALLIVEEALDTLINRGCQIECIKLVVSPYAPISRLDLIDTRFGPLRVSPRSHVFMGTSYVIEDRYKGFAWVSRRSVEN